MRIVAWDLETTDLKALMGRVLCCSFCPILEEGRTERPYTFRGDDKKYKHRDPINDRKLVVASRDELEKYNLVIGWNSKLFDLPFLNARLAQYGERPFRPQFHMDPMYYARGSGLRIGSSKLDNVQKFFSLPETKTPITWDDWKRAAMGDKPAMDNVVDHCEQDVKVLSMAYWKLLPMAANIHR